MKWAFQTGDSVRSSSPAIGSDGTITSGPETIISTQSTLTVQKNGRLKQGTGRLPPQR